MVVPSLLRENPQFRRFWLGQTVSLLGDQVSLIALPLVAVLTLDANAAQMGYLVAAELAPNLLFSLHAGAWADQRARKRQIMIATDLGRALAIGSIPVAYAFDALTFPHMFVVAFLMGTLSVLFQVSYNPLFVALVPRERFVEGGSIMHGSRALSYVAGPSIGGLLVQAITAPVTLVVDACSYVVSALFLRSVEAEEPAPEAPGKGHVVAGIRWVFGNAIVRPALGATATINFFNFAFFALFILYATKSLDVPPGTLGLVLGAGAVGGVIGSVITGRVARRIGSRAGVRHRLRRLPRATVARAARRGAALGDPHLPLPRRVRVRARRDDARHQRRRNFLGGGSGPAALTRRGRLHGRELRRPPAGGARRRRARELDRTQTDPVDRDGGRARGMCLAAAVADPRAPRVAGTRGWRRLAADLLLDRLLGAFGRVLGGLPGVIGLVLGLAHAPWA